MTGGQRSPTPLSQRPAILRAASTERLADAENARKNRAWPMAIYCAGLSVECLLQAFALKAGAAADAHHDLTAWLRKTPVRLQDTIRDRAGADWSRLVSSWDNRIRFYDQVALRALVRSRELDRGVKGSDDAIMAHVAQCLLESAQRLVTKGLMLWPR